MQARADLGATWRLTLVDDFVTKGQTLLWGPQAASPKRTPAGRSPRSSANLTEAALDRNIELGLLVRDRALAASVSNHFQALIDRRLLRRLPGS